MSDNLAPVDEPIDRMNLLDVAMEMVDGAEKISDPTARRKLTTEARRLLNSCHTILERHNAAGRGGASVDLTLDLNATEQRIVALEAESAQ